MKNLGDTIVFSDPEQYLKVRAFIDGEVTCKSCNHWSSNQDDDDIDGRKECVRLSNGKFSLHPVLTPPKFSCSLWEKKV